MDTLYSTLVAQLADWSPTEIVAVALAIIYLLLAIRQNIWCWFCAGISTAIYIWLFFAASLYMESLLNLFYFGMAVYGWHTWHTADGNSHELPVAVWPLRVHATAIAVIAVLVFVAGTLLSQHTDAAFPFADSATTFSAIWATFLVARKVLENWWYWLVIDTASVFIYWSRGLELTSLLFVFYVLLIPVGLISWSRSYRQSVQPVPA